MLNRIFRLLIIPVIILAFHSFGVAQFLRPRQVNELPSTPYDHRIHYGRGPFQFGDLRLPKRSGRAPVAVVIHGGCWKAFAGADVQNTAPLSSSLTSAGIATWNIEYRRVDNEGGGWPGTFEDVAGAIDHLRVLARSYPLDLKRVVIVGHSAGGHLGTLAAARKRLPKDSPLYARKPLRVLGVVNLAGPTDVEDIVPIQSQVCGDSVVTKLVGGSPLEVPDRYRQASPSRLLPLRVKQILITGAQDKLILPEWGRRYEELARIKGDDVKFQAIENAAHFEVIAPGSVAWPSVENAVFSMLGLKSDLTQPDLKH